MAIPERSNFARPLAEPEVSQFDYEIEDARGSMNLPQSIEN
jgi:hypothetical protein